MSTPLAALEKEEDDNGEGGSETPSTTTSTPIGPNQGSGAGTGSPGTTPATPTGKPNIKQYMDANADAGKNLADGIQTRYGQKQEEFGKTLNEANNQFDNASKPLEQKLGADGTQKIQQAFKDPSAILSQQDQLGEFQKLRSGGYQQDINQLNNGFQQQKSVIQNQLGNLGAQANMAKTEDGRFQLLRDNLNQPNYTRGQQRLDQLFLQAQPGATKNLSKNLQSQYQQSSDALNGIDATAQARLQALGGLAQDGKYTGLLGDRINQWNNLYDQGATEGFDTDVSGRGISDIKTSTSKAQQDLKASTDQLGDIQARMQSPGQLTREDLKYLGLDDKFGGSTYGHDLNQYYGGINKNPTMQQASSQEDFQRYRALQQLAGSTDDIYNGATEVGGFNPVTVSPGIRAGLENAQKTWEIDNFNAARDKFVNGNWRNPNEDSSSAIEQFLINPLKSAQNADEAYRVYDAAHQNGTLDMNFLDQIDGNGLRGYFDELFAKRSQSLGPSVNNPVPGTPPGWKPPTNKEYGEGYVEPAPAEPTDVNGDGVIDKRDWY